MVSAAAPELTATEAETAVLAAIMSDDNGGDRLDAAVGMGLNREAFSDWRNGAIFGAAQRIRAANLVCDAISVCSDLAAVGEIERVGGDRAVLTVAHSDYSAAAFPQHVELIITRATQRKAIVAARETIQALSVEYLNRDEMRDAVSAPLARVENHLHQQARIRSLAAAADEAIRRAQQRINGADDGLVRVYTGIPAFDKYGTPIEPHELVCIGARPSVGKSSLSRQIAWNGVKAGLNVAVFLLETSDTSFAEACAAQEARISAKGIFEAPRDRQQRYLDQLAMIRGLKNLRIYDRDMTMDAIESRVRVLKAGFQPHLVIVDYLQIIRGRREDVSTADAIGDITQRFVAMVKFLGCPVVLMSQLNRAGERNGNREPVLSDLRDSGSIEADAHRVVFIHRPTMSRDGTNQLSDTFRATFDCELIQAKLRDGPKTSVPVKFWTQWATFEDAA